MIPKNAVYVFRDGDQSATDREFLARAMANTAKISRRDTVQWRAIKDSLPIFKCVVAIRWEQDYFRDSADAPLPDTLRFWRCGG